MTSTHTVQSKFRTCAFGHPNYQTWFCPECARINLSTPQMSEFTYSLGVMTSRIHEVFLAPNIGDWSIDLIIKHCSELKETQTFLDDFKEGTLSYNLAKMHVFNAIKTGMNSWIDGRAIPPNESEIPQ